MSATEAPDPGTTAAGLRPLVEDLHARRDRARLGGGEERIARQHEQKKLTARERLDLLIDEVTFTELGIHAQPHFSQRAMEGKEAPADGVVTGAAYNGNYGNLVTLDHGLGLVTRYGHLSSFATRPGQRVKRGDIIGYVGSTGRSTGPHLHYEVRVNNVPVNPLEYILNAF